MALPTVSDVNSQARSIVADTSPDWLTDAILLPYVQRAYRKAARVLRAAGVRLLVKDSASISVAAATITLNRGSGTQYPSDLVRPLILKERAAAPPGQAYTQMQQSQEFFPEDTPGGLRKLWDWRGDVICIPAASGTSDIIIRYEAELPALTGNSSEILIVDGMDAIALLTAGYAAQARDEQSTSQQFIASAMDDLSNLIQSELGAKVARGAAMGRS